MDLKLAQLASLSQKDKGPAYSALIHASLAQSSPDVVAADIHLIVDAIVNQDSGSLVVARQVLAELVRVLADGPVKDSALRKRLLEDSLSIIQPRIVSYEEQVGYSSGALLASLIRHIGEWTQVPTR